MAQPQLENRPPQVRFGAGLVIVAAALHVIGSFDDMATLRSIDTKDRVSQGLRQAGNLNLSLDQVLGAMHVGILVSAAAATAAVVLGVQALKGDRRAPMLLIAAAFLIVAGSLLTDPMMGMFVAAGTVLLWSGQARDWYAGREIRPSRLEIALSEATSGNGPVNGPVNGPGEGSGHESTRPGQPDGQQGPHYAPPAQGQPQPHPQQPQLHNPYAQPSQQPHYGHGAPGGQVPAYGAPAYGPGQPRPDGTPATVKTAAILTIVASGLAALGMGLGALAFMLLPVSTLQRGFDEAVAGQPGLREELPPGFDLADLRVAVAVVMGLLFLWCLFAIALAVLTWRRHNWARILLIISAVVTAVVTLMGLPGSILHLGAAIAVVVLLVLPASNQWFSQQSQFAPMPGYPQQPYGQQPPHGQQGYAGQQPPAHQAPEQQPGQRPHEQRAPDPTRDEDGKPPLW